MSVLQLPQSTIPSWELGTVAKSPLEARNKEYRQGLQGYWSASAGGSEGVFDLSANMNHALNSGMVWGNSEFGRVITGTYAGTQHMPLLGVTSVGSLPCTIWAHQQVNADHSHLMCDDNPALAYGLRQAPTALQIKASGHGEILSVITDTEWHQILITVTEAGVVVYYRDGVVLGGDTGMTGTFTIDNLIGSPSGTYAINGQFRACGIWNTIFTPSMIEKLAGDPYAVERKEEYVTVFGAGGAPAGNRTYYYNLASRQIEEAA